MGESERDILFEDSRCRHDPSEIRLKEEGISIACAGSAGEQHSTRLTAHGLKAGNKFEIVALRGGK